MNKRAWRGRAVEPQGLGKDIWIPIINMTSGKEFLVRGCLDMFSDTLNLICSGNIQGDLSSTQL